MLRRPFILLSLAVVVSMLATACGATPAPTATTPAKTAAPAGPTTAPTTAAKGAVTFVFCKSDDAVEGMDPANYSANPTITNGNAIFEHLYENSDPSGVPQPGLATSYEASPDAMTWTFHLRQGVKFTDGTPLNADAVLWNFTRQWDPAHPYHQPPYDSTKFINWVDYLGWGLKGDPNGLFKDMVKVDDNTVRFILNYPNPDFLVQLTQCSLVMASPASFDKYKETIKDHPVGTGPFVMESWTKDDRMVLTKNPDYWNKDKVFIDKLVFRVIKDASARYLAVKAGDCQGMDLVSPEIAQSAKGEPNLTVTVKPPSNIGVLRFNPTLKPFDDKNVRLAVAYAIDKKTLVDTLFAGLAVVADQVIPPGWLGNNPSLKGYSYDPAKAKEMLKAAGLESGFTTDFWYYPYARASWPNPKAAAEAVATMLAKVGIICNVKTEDTAAWNADYKAGKFPLYQLSTTPDFAGPQIYDVFFRDEPFGSGLSSKQGYTSKKFYDLITPSRKEGDPAKRKQLLQDAAAVIQDEIPVIPIVHSQEPEVWSNKVTGYVPVPLIPDKFIGVGLKP